MTHCWKKCKKRILIKSQIEKNKFLYYSNWESVMMALLYIKRAKAAMKRLII